MGEVALLTVLIFAAGYLAAMALVRVVPEVIKPTALALNILVATVATVRFYRAGTSTGQLSGPSPSALSPWLSWAAQSPFPATSTSQPSG